MEEQNKDLGDLVKAAKRHSLAMTLTGTVILVVGLLLARFLPPTYESIATILIEEQEIPQEFVRSTVTSYATQRIQSISQRVMTRGNLLEIINKYDLYKDERKREPTEVIVAMMRDNIRLDMIQGMVGDRRTGREGAIAFTVGFQGEVASVVKKVANEITSLYLNENLKTRTEKATETYAFLTEEAERLNKLIAEQEAQIAKFKAEHRTELPELQSLNMGLLDRLERELSDTDNTIQSMQDRISYLEDQLALLDPNDLSAEDALDNPALDPATRLRLLKSNYRTLTANYSETHPDVLRVRRQIDTLEAELGEEGSEIAGETGDHEQLAALRVQLANTRQAYSDEHPDVIKLEKMIAALEQELAAEGGAGNLTTDSSAPKNPAYVVTKRNLELAEIRLRQLHKQRTQIRARMDEVEQRLMRTPQVEREYGALTRDHANTRTKYQEIKAKQLAAQVGQQMEQERKGERFTLIEPAALPEEPIKPNRPAIVVISLVLAIAGAIGMAATLEGLDTSVRGEKGIYNLLAAAPLAVIPYQSLDAEVRGSRRKRWLTLWFIVGTIVCAIVLFHLFWTPLDVLWFKALRKADLTAVE